MLAKGIIDSINFSSNTCIVRIPQFETANSDPIIISATFSITPGMYNGYKENDVVWVAFENDKLEHPVVIGKLFLGTEKENKDPRGTINCMISTTSQKANIPQDTVLTNEVGDDIPNTQVPYNNINELANKLNDVDVNLEYSVRDIDNRIKMKVNAVDGDDSTGWGWELSPSGWSITTGGKEFFTVNKDGMTVKNKGKIGQFSVGAAHTCKITGKEESGIYSDNYIERFEDNPDGKTGVYVGTDGIKLGNDFYITTDGEIGATKFSATFSNLLKTSTNIQDGNSNINGVYCHYTVGKDWGGHTDYENQLINLVPSHLWNERTQEYLIAATEEHSVFNREDIISWVALPDFKEYLNTNDHLNDYILSFKGIIIDRVNLKNLQLYLGYINGTTFNTITELKLQNESLDNLLIDDYTQLHYQLPSGYNINSYSNLRIGFKWKYDSSTNTKVFGKIKEIKIEKNTMDVVNKSYTFSYSQYDLTNTRVGGIKGEVSYNGRYTNAEMEVWKNSTTAITFPDSAAARAAFGIAENDLFNVISITKDTTDSKVYTFTCRMSDLDDNSNIVGKILSTVVSAESTSQVYLYRGTNTDSAPAYTGEESQWISNILEPNATNPFVWRITGIKTAEATTYIEATIALIASGTGIISILSASTIDGKDVDLIELDTSTTPNRYVMHADKLTGTVNSNVHIGHDAYGFDIISGDRSHPSAIYSGITNFNDSEHDKGVYLGTDGINIGQKFKVDSEGQITAIGLAAEKIEVEDESGITIFKADTTANETIIGGFNATANALQSSASIQQPGHFKLTNEQNIYTYSAYESLSNPSDADVSYEYKCVAKITFTESVYQTKLFVKLSSGTGDDYLVVSTKNAPSVPDSKSHTYCYKSIDVSNWQDRIDNNILTWVEIPLYNISAGDYVYVYGYLNKWDNQNYIAPAGPVYFAVRSSIATISSVGDYYTFHASSSFNLTAADIPMLTIANKFNIYPDGELNLNNVLRVIPNGGLGISDKIYASSQGNLTATSITLNPLPKTGTRFVPLQSSIDGDWPLGDFGGYAAKYVWQCRVSLSAGWTDINEYIPNDIRKKVVNVIISEETSSAAKATKTGFYKNYTNNHTYVYADQAISAIIFVVAEDSEEWYT